VSWRLTCELLFVIVVVVASGCFVGAVMAVVVIVDAVMSADISIDVTDVTAPS
jgi:endonuclease V-like protein UPF0215 family